MDEADEMLALGFLEDMEAILRYYPKSANLPFSRRPCRRALLRSPSDFAQRRTCID
jgi:superfamily II DNA/RNA helicase